MPLRRAVAWVPGKMQFRNGTEPLDLLPLWYERRGKCPQKVGIGGALAT